MNSKRTVAVLTTSRADFCHLYWPLKHMHEHAALEVRLIAAGAQLSPEFGTTLTDIENEGFTVDETVECLLSSDTDVGMAKTIGIATLGLTEVLDRSRPDILLLIADRYEMLAPASVALALRIPIAHIEGGETSEGAIDDAVRNALTKLSHIHFTPTAQARRRVLAMGEQPWRVHRVGAPSLDHLEKRKLLPRRALEERLGIELDGQTSIISYHPVTLLDDTIAEADAVFGALDRLRLRPLFCFPNCDAGSRGLIQKARAYCHRRPEAHLFVNLDPLLYWSLLAQAVVMIGNSSSGIMETPSLRLPTVNVGLRQQGRERALNIIDAPAEVSAIVAAVGTALSSEFAASLEAMQNPYGDGHAGERIAAILAEAPARERLLHKQAPAVVDRDDLCAFRHEL